MLVGRFGNTSGRPYLEGRLVIPRLNLSADLSFLVDTGADITYITPAEAMRIRLPYSQLHRSSTPTYGVGGATEDFAENCLLAFADAENLYVYEREIHIAPQSDSMMSLPALLGRDVIDNCRMDYHPFEATLQFLVVEADVVMPLSGMSTFPPISPENRRE